MTIKTSTAYDQAGFRTTKSLVDFVRELLGRTVPDSLSGEPASFSSGSFTSRRRATAPPAKKRAKSMKKK